MDTTVVIAVPSHGMLYSRTAVSIAALVKCSHVPTGLLCIEGSVLPNNRNLLVQHTQAQKASHIFFLDSDMLCNGDVIDLLLAHGKAVIGAAYNKRGSIPAEPTVQKLWDDGVYRSVTAIPNTPFMCDGLGMGCTLIRMDIFDRLTKPYFRYMNDGAELYGEDTYFCEQARKAGFEIWCDPTIPVKHIGEFLY